MPNNLASAVPAPWRAELELCVGADERVWLASSSAAAMSATTIPTCVRSLTATYVSSKVSASTHSNKRGSATARSSVLT